MNVTTPRLIELCKVLDITETVYAIIAPNEIVIPAPCDALDVYDNIDRYASLDTVQRQQQIYSLSSYDQANIHITEEPYGLDYQILINEEYEG